MLASMNSLRNCIVRAYDDAIGNVIDFHFDTYEWTTRYFVVDSGGFMPGKRLLIPPVALGWADLPRREFFVHCTKQEIAQMQTAAFDAVMSRRDEDAIYRHFEMRPDDWRGMRLPGSFGIHVVASLEADALAPLHSFGELRGFAVKAGDDHVGTLDDLFVEDAHWDQQVIVIALERGAGRVTAPVDLARPIDWRAREALIDAPAEVVRKAPQTQDRDGFEMEFLRAVKAHYDEAV